MTKHTSSTSGGEGPEDEKQNSGGIARELADSLFSEDEVTVDTDDDRPTTDEGDTQS